MNRFHLYTNMKKNSGSALLFAIVTAFVLAMVGGALVLLTSNQYRVINTEINRIEASYLLQAGAEYAIYRCYTGAGDLTKAYSLDIDGDGNNDVDIAVAPDTTGLSEYTVTVTNRYES